MIREWDPTRLSPGLGAALSCFRGTLPLVCRLVSLQSVMLPPGMHADLTQLCTGKDHLMLRAGDPNMGWDSATVGRDFT
jgi:hypothetical protein